MKTLGELIRTARLAQHWTQRELAEQMNVSRSAVSNWENDKTEPDFTTICGLSAVLHCDFVSQYVEIIADSQPPESKMKMIFSKSSEITVKSSKNAGKMIAGTIDIRINGSDILGNAIDFRIIAPFSLEIPVEHS